MKTLLQIQQQLANGQFEFSQHAFRRAVELNISEREIREAGVVSEIVENHPDDKYSPSGLLLGFTQIGRPLHFQVSYAESDSVKIITIYEPEPDEWIDFRKRR